MIHGSETADGPPGVEGSTGEVLVLSETVLVRFCLLLASDGDRVMIFRGAPIQLIEIIARAACTVLCVHPLRRSGCICGTGTGTWLHQPIDRLHLSSPTRHSGSTGNKTGPRQ